MSEETKTKVRRFHMTIMEERGVIPIEHEIGEWVKHCEHSAKLATIEAERDAYTFKSLGTIAELGNKIAALEAEVQKLREALNGLSDACYDVQDWSGTRVGEYLEQAFAALNSNAGEKEGKK